LIELTYDGPPESDFSAQIGRPGPHRGVNHDEPCAWSHEHELTEQSGQKEHPSFTWKYPQLIAVAGKLRVGRLYADPDTAGTCRVASAIHAAGMI
jgi:hypothetical protein